jgi:CheY-like chemotaxis protein
MILDMNMPGLGGAGSLPFIRALWPRLPILLSTGRVDQAALDLTLEYEGVTLLAKPFTMKELQEMLGKVIP